ncbi:MAG: hypothetical protein AMJ93_07045, partial [Anaerolineae bacterium SM23_84]
MPKTGMTQETSTIVEWLVKEGEYVEKGQPLLEVMTDKVNMEVEAPASGILTNIKAAPNDVVPVTQVIAYIAEPGEEIIEQVAAEAVPVREEPAPTEEPAAPAPMPAAAPRTPGRVRATPMARRLAKEHMLDLGIITGTGPGGAITKADVLEAAQRGPEPTAPVPPATRTVPLVGRRRIIAERMQQSARQAPHIALTIEVDTSAAQAARGDASYTAMLIHAVARVLRKHPLLNSTLRGDQIVLLSEINIGVAVAAEDGLIVPVVKQADSKSLHEIDAELKELTQRARAGDLTLDDVTGGT